MKIIIMAIKGCGQLKSRNTYFSDIWFSGVKTAEEAVSEVVDHCGTVKTIHGFFCLATLEKLIKYWPGGSYLVPKSNPRVTGDRPFLTIGYKYSSRKVLGFIATEGSGSNEPVGPYLSCSPEIF